MRARTVVARRDAKRVTAPLFDGFPYLVTRVFSNLRHFLLLPSDIETMKLVHLAQVQLEMNQLDTALVLDEDMTYYHGADGSRCFTRWVPRGGTPVSGKLRPAVTFPLTGEMGAREALLQAFVELHGTKSGHVLAAGKGGRKPTKHELEELGGFQNGGVPRGLIRCDTCKEWRGECLDPDLGIKDRLTTVHCRCDNHNRCASCGHALADRRLNANFFNTDNREIWHVPGFLGLSHHCPPTLYLPTVH